MFKMKRAFAAVVLSLAAGAAACAVASALASNPDDMALEIAGLGCTLVDTSYQTGDMVMVFACATKATVLRFTAGIGGTIRQTAVHHDNPTARQKEVATTELTERLDEYLKSKRHAAP